LFNCKKYLHSGYWLRLLDSNMVRMPNMSSCCFLKSNIGAILIGEFFFKKSEAVLTIFKTNISLILTLIFLKVKGELQHKAGDWVSGFALWAYKLSRCNYPSETMNRNILSILMYILQIHSIFLLISSLIKVLMHGTWCKLYH